MVADERQLRVTIIGLNYTPEPTGIAPYTAGLAEGLLRHGDAVRVITGKPHYPQWEIYEGYEGRTTEETIDGVDVVRIHHSVPNPPGSVRRAMMELRFGFGALFSDWDEPDVVVLVTPALLATRMLGIRARFSRQPYCVWVQDIYSLGVIQAGGGAAGSGKPGIAARLIGAIERATLRSATLVVAIHERFKRFIVEELGVAAGRVAVVRNWSHVDALPSLRNSSVRRGHGWADDDVVVLHAGNMGAKQGLENVVLASRLASERGSRVRFVLLGDGNQRPALEAMGANDRLQFIDPLPDGEFERTLASCDILLVNERPGLTEMSVPSKLTSYFSTGLPVIAAVDAGSITADELRDAGAGPRVDASDPLALLLAAEGLSVADALVFGAAGQRFREERLTADAAITAFREELLGLVPEPRAAELGGRNGERSAGRSGRSVLR